MIRDRKIERLLVANRGEIACRIFRTAKRMGLRTIAVYSDADRNALHRAMADESIRLGPAAADQSYLAIEKIIDAARQAGADAIHPGYGFLAENGDFAESCGKAGIIFVGPKAPSIRAMGLKDEAKALMEAAGVPVVPGYHGKARSLDRLRREAEAIGYPVLVKAVAGGGGKGMRRVERAAELEEAIAGAQREAEKAFGNSAVLIEKYLTRPRHIEVQILGDQNGNVIHLFERDCSLQRRHQKVIEEAPAPGMTEGLRSKMCKAALKAARAIDYVGAGTVEFIVDASAPLCDDTDFYFMEMNTRLQVEHPVTEMLTGKDLVELQIEIAEGRAIPFDQPTEVPRAHAIELRLYAEDPNREFLPQTGKLIFFRLDGGPEGVRFDAGFREGDQISPHYDPLIGKIIARGDSRKAAIDRLKAAIDLSFVAGCVTNLSYLRKILDHPEFVDGDVDTRFLDRHQKDLAPARAEPGRAEIGLAALALQESRKNRRRGPTWPGADRYSPWAASDGWRLNLDYEEAIELVSAGHRARLSVIPRQGDIRIAFEDAELTASGTLAGDGGLSARIEGREFEVLAAVERDRITIARGPEGRSFTIASRADDEEVTTEGPGTVRAPMPGRILKIFAKPGQAVEVKTPLLIMEAMKMEYTLAAPRSGVVGKMAVKEGDQVAEGATILEVEAAD